MQNFVRISYESQWGSRSLGLVPVNLWPLRLDVKPHPPRGWKLQVKRALVKLSEPINMFKGSFAELALELPVDIGLYVNGVLVGSLPIGRVKYAIYGTPDLGDPCRYVDSRILEELPSYLKGTVSVEIYARFDEDLVQISKIVIPTLGLGSYLTSEGKPVFSKIVLEVYGKTSGIARPKAVPSL
ncbi:MAG: DUF432 domain-containing protein, partial [Acidilobaceae archaeon]